MSVNKFWFRNAETKERITAFIDNEFKLSDNFLTIYQLQAFAQSDDSEFITSEPNKELGFTFAEFISCQQINITTLPEQYELYFQAQPHKRPTVEVFMEDDTEPDDVDKLDDDSNLTKLYFNDIKTFKSFRSKLDRAVFYTIDDVIKLHGNDSTQFIVLPKDKQTSSVTSNMGWRGSVLLERCDFGARITTGKGDRFYIYLPKLEEVDITAKTFDDSVSVFNVHEKEKLTRQYILERAIETCCHDRQDQYGSPENSFNTIAHLWDDYIELKYPKVRNTAFFFTKEDVSIMMALMKIARQISGQGKMDNFVDCSAYIAIAGEMWSKSQKND